MAMTKRTRKTARRGFTLIEAALVVTIGGLIMATTVPKAITLRRQMELDTAAYRLAQELRAAQHEAVRRNANVTVTLSGTNAYTVGTRRVTLPDGITFHASSSSSMTFVPIGPVVGLGTGRFSLNYTSNVRTNIDVSAAGMVTVARHNAVTVVEPVLVVDPVISVPSSPSITPVAY